jgi:hypothetical protein
VEGQVVVCLSFLHFAKQPLKQLKTMKRHRHALNFSKKYEIVSFWESHKHLSQKDIAQRFEFQPVR